MNNGWIKLHRQLLEWEWYSETNTFRLFIHLLLKANHKPKNYKGVLINIGQVMTGLNLLAEQTGLTVQKIRTALNNLKSTNEITIKSTNKGTIIQIVNYEKYQVLTSETTNKQQTNNKQITTNNNDNNIKNENKLYIEEKKYTQNNFLERWKDARLHYDKQPTNIKKLTDFETISFNDLLKDYKENDFDKAIAGMFQQKTYKATRLRPTHFLQREHFEKYLTCFVTKEKLYDDKFKKPVDRI